MAGGRGTDLLFQQGLGNDLSDLLVSEFVEVHAVDRQGLLFLIVKFQARFEQVGVSHACLSGGILGGLGESGEVLLWAFAHGEVTVFQVLEGNRAEQHDAGELLSVGLVASELGNEINQQFLVTVGGLRAREGFVVTEHGEDHVGFDMLEVLAHRGEALASGILVGSVPGQAHVAEGYFLTLQFALQESLSPTVVLHAVRQSIAENGHCVSFFKSKGGMDRGNLREPRLRQRVIRLPVALPSCPRR